MDSGSKKFAIELIEKMGFDSAAFGTKVAAYVVAALLLVLLCIVVHWAARKILLKVITPMAERTKNRWDDALIANKFFDWLSHVAPALVLYQCSPLVFSWNGDVIAFVKNIALAYMILMVARAMDGFLSAVVDIYRNFDRAKNRPIKSYVQVGKIILYIIAGILLVATLLDKNPSGILVGLGGMSAVLLLVFKDSLMGLAASVQLVNNDMLRRGDWITVPSHKADGDVLDISLNTVKIKNFDNTITTVPTYALISNAFQNWRGMQESGGRRIKRAISIDMNTIRFCDARMLETFKGFSLLNEYLEQKLNEVGSPETTRVTDGRKLTNIGTFRAYVVAYLKAHPKINKDLTFLVRQLPPAEHGLAIELYVFSSDKIWANYEGIQADIFDHLLAILPEFGLKPFQHATGNDFRRAFESR